MFDRMDLNERPNSGKQMRNMMMVNDHNANHECKTQANFHTNYHIIWHTCDHGKQTIIQHHKIKIHDSSVEDEQTYMLLMIVDDELIG